MKFDIDPDIRRAKTLPSVFYTDPNWFEMSKDRIFANTWQLVGRTADVESITPITLLPGFLDEPVLVVRTADGLSCFSNVCTHRGKILVEEACTATLIRCGYHGRRFSLEGKFLSMPEFEGVVGFPSELDDLHRYRSATIGGFHFVSISPLSDLETSLGAAAPILQEYEQRELTLRSEREYQVAAHWALYCENYLEGFHIPFVHRSLNEIVDYGTYATETFRYSSLQTGRDDRGNVAGRYLFIFPNTMFNFYPWGISVNIVEPLDPSHTRVRFLTFVTDDAQLEAGAGRDLHRIELEDESVVESVQKGIRSRFYKHGRYSPTREQGTHHFHSLIAEFMN